MCVYDKNFLTCLWLRGVLARCYLSKRERETFHHSLADKELHRLISEAAAAPGAARPDTHTNDLTRIHSQMCTLTLFSLAKCLH